ncbi:MAG: MbcA/ParS/Xre antitoxin family protein [Acetobacteraceae bacterium]|nr:MbcA/ParS/Xre antitoxin family protein [Acetobacteraceae bacterium]
MPATLLEGSFTPQGLVAMDRLAEEVRVTKTELAALAGLSRDAVSKTARATSPATQARLRDVVEILNRIQGWSGSPTQALAWYRAQPLPGFGDRTAEELVKDGRAEAVKRHLGRIAEGGFA